MNTGTNQQCFDIWGEPAKGSVRLANINTAANLQYLLTECPCDFAIKQVVALERCKCVGC